MPAIRKLEAEEVQKLSSKGESARAQVAREYDGYLANFSPDDYGEATVDENESKLTVKNRLKAAAERRGLTVNFLRTSGPLIRFQVQTPSEEQVNQNLAEAPKPKRGRKPKAAAAAA